MACSAPSSVTVKSFAVRPSTGLPLLSFTFTVSITNWLLVEKVAGVSPAGEVFWPTCWASNGRAEATTIRRKASVARIILEPQHKSRGQTAHGIGRQRQTELRAAKRSVPAGEGDVVDGIGGINPQIAAEPVGQSERAPGRSVQSELRRPGNGIAPRVAKLARRGRGISGRVERQAGRRIIDRRPRVIWS